MKKIWNKPITWGGYAKLCAIAYAATAAWYVWWLEVSGLFSTLDWARNKVKQIKKWFIR
jgi:hypothetical protein